MPAAVQHMPPESTTALGANQYLRRPPMRVDRVTAQDIVKVRVKGPRHLR